MTSLQPHGVRVNSHINHSQLGELCTPLPGEWQTRIQNTVYHVLGTALGEPEEGAVKSPDWGKCPEGPPRTWTLQLG